MQPSYGNNFNATPGMGYTPTTPQGVPIASSGDDIVLSDDASSHKSKKPILIILGFVVALVVCVVLFLVISMSSKPQKANNDALLTTLDDYIDYIIYGDNKELIAPADADANSNNEDAAEEDEKENVSFEYSLDDITTLQIISQNSPTTNTEYYERLGEKFNNFKEELDKYNGSNKEQLLEKSENYENFLDLYYLTSVALTTYGRDMPDEDVAVEVSEKISQDDTPSYIYSNLILVKKYIETDYVDRDAGELFDQNQINYSIMVQDLKDLRLMITGGKK